MKTPVNRKDKNTKLFILLIKAYKRFFKIRGHPREIAFGFALGLFIGMTPTIGFQTAIAVFFATLLKWSKISAAAGVWITNPVTAPFIYSVTYLVGAKFLGIQKMESFSSEINVESLRKILNNTSELFGVLTVGGIIVGFPLAFAGYYFSYKAILKYRENIKIRIKRQKEKFINRKIKSRIKRR